MKYKVINLETEESHGEYETLAEARGCVLYDKLETWQIWRDGHELVERCDPLSDEMDTTARCYTQAGHPDMETKEPVRITVVTRDLGHGSERFEVTGRFTGETDAFGKRTFKAYVLYTFQAEQGERTLYLFNDEITPLHECPPL